MKLASFQVQTPVGRFTRIGSVQGDDQLIDLSSAYVTLQARRGEAQPYRLKEAFVPPDMRRLIEESLFTLIGEEDMLPPQSNLPSNARNEVEPQVHRQQFAPASGRE